MKTNEQCVDDVIEDIWRRERADYESRLRQVGADPKRVAGLYALSKRFGLSGDYGTTGAFEDRQAESFVHELAHALCEGTLLEQDENESSGHMATTAATVKRIKGYRSCRRIDERELLASAVEEEVFQILGWQLDEYRYRRGTLLAFTHRDSATSVAEFGVHMTSFRRLPAVRALARDIADLVRAQK